MAKNFGQIASPEELETFEQFVFEMDDVLEPFIEKAKSAGFSLDYSIESLDALERELLSQPTNGDDGQLQNRAARYLGEVFRKNIGGKWELCLKDPKYLFFKLPVITGYSKLPIEFCPIEVVSNFMWKKELGLCKRAIESHLEFRDYVSKQ